MDFWGLVEKYGFGLAVAVVVSVAAWRLIKDQLAKSERRLDRSEERMDKHVAGFLGALEEQRKLSREAAASILQQMVSGFDRIEDKIDRKRR